MNIPGFTAEEALYQRTVPYRNSTRDHLPVGAVLPALPSEQTCDWAWGKCEQCIASGRRNCPVCNILGWC